MSKGEQVERDQRQPDLQPEHTESESHNGENYHWDRNTKKFFEQGSIGLFFDHVTNPEGVVYGSTYDQQDE